MVIQCRHLCEDNKSFFFIKALLSSRGILRKAWRFAIVLLRGREFQSYSTEFSQERPHASTSTDDRNFPLCARRYRTATPVEKSGPPLLQTLEVWYQGQPCVEGFPSVVFMQDNHPFAFRSRHTISGNICSQYVHWSQWRAVLFMDEGLALKVSRRIIIWRKPGTRFYP
ncbi:hypothetical protein TNCV_4567271 [Trichonephila clavipes]|nr:hypothetical protein TNCV_4567271 [Trichonephila clavipes]